MSKEEISQILQEALKCLENADYVGYFEEMDKLKDEMSGELKNIYSNLKNMFMGGSYKYEHNFYQQLAVFVAKIAEINKYDKKSIIRKAQEIFDKKYIPTKIIDILRPPKNKIKYLVMILILILILFLVVILYTYPTNEKQEITQQDIHKGLEYYKHKNYSKAFVLLQKNHDTTLFTNKAKKVYKELKEKAEKNSCLALEFMEEWVKSGYSKKQAEDEYKIGKLYMSNSCNYHNYDKAEYWFLKSLEHGNEKAKVYLCHIYSIDEFGGKQDSDKANKFCNNN